jgi:hypothetical protein
MRASSTLIPLSLLLLRSWLEQRWPPHPDFGRSSGKSPPRPDCFGRLLLCGAASAGVPVLSPGLSCARRVLTTAAYRRSLTQLTTSAVRSPTLTGGRLRVAPCAFSLLIGVFGGAAPQGGCSPRRLGLPLTGLVNIIDTPPIWEFERTRLCTASGIRTRVRRLRRETRRYDKHAALVSGF